MNDYKNIPIENCFVILEIHHYANMYFGKVYEQDILNSQK